MDATPARSRSVARPGRARLRDVSSARAGFTCLARVLRARVIPGPGTFFGAEISSLMKINHVKFILPALTEATSPFWRPIKYSLFPPLGLATLASYLDPDLKVSLQDEHVEKLDLDDEPDLVRS